MVLIHVVTALVTPYGFHRDEFLYMAMGRNLRLFAMDFPPFIAILSELQRALFGDTLAGLRFAPALAHGALVVLTALIAAAFGGRAFAQILAMLAVATVPLYLRAGSLFQPVVFDQLWWTLALFALVRLSVLERAWPEGRNYWLLLGLAGGLGLLTKFSIAFLGFGILCAILLVRRGWLRTPGPWLVLGMTVLLGAPSWIGQIQIGYPVLPQMDDLRASQLERIGYAEFLLEHVLMHGPGGFLLALLGVVALLRRRLSRWRVVGVACLVAFGMIMALRGKPYYTGPIFPTLYAAGAVALGASLARGHGWLARNPGRRTAARAASAILVSAWGLLAFPLALPLLPPEPTARFAAALGITSAVRTNQGVVLELPQDYADMLGWERKVATVARVYQALPPEERSETVIIADNYGQAGAVDFYGPSLGLPEAEVPVGSYWFWGPGDKPGAVILKIGGEAEDLEPFCGSLELRARIREPWVVPEERDLPIWICRDPPRTLQEIWPAFRGRN